MIGVAFPVNWNTKRLKYIATYNDDVLSEDTDELKEIDYVEISGVSLQAGIEEISRLAFHEAPSRARRKVRNGDILISTVRTYLRAIATVKEAPDDLIASTGFCVVRPSAEVDSGFLGWAARSEPFVGEVVARSVGVSYPAINATDLVTINIPLPPLDAQRRIAGFLDDKTARIDGLIEKKRALLDRLAEKRQALITRAVTRGLNPTAPLKPSGIDWLGDIPAHWEVKRLRFAAKTNPTLSSFDLEDDLAVSFVPMDAVGEYGGLRLDSEKLVADIGSGYTPFAEGDVLVAKITPCFENGKGAIATNLTNGLGFGTTELHVLRATAEMDRDYLFYITISESFRKIGESEMYGAGGQKRISQSYVKDFRVAIPPLTDQVEIVRMLKQYEASLAELAQKINLSIESLISYRQSLVTASVTGQVVELQ